MNNPWASSPRSTVSDTAQRYPDVLAQDPDLQLPHYGQHQQQPQQQQGYLQQQYTGFNGQPQYQQPQQTGYLQSQPTGWGGGAPSPSPSALYGQPTGYGQQQYGYQPQQPAPQQPYAADLDPYANLGALTSVGSGGQGQGQVQQQQGQPGGTLLAVQQTQSHPRQYVQEQKNALMAWDEYAWKQLFGRFDALREAWETRKAGISAAANQGADPTQIMQLRKEAENNIDSCHAAKMQVDEVKSGWRHSTDAASKARVREALNAGLSALPDYPLPLSPSQLGGSFHQSATKSSIMSQFASAAPNAQYYQPLQAQVTGFGGGGYGGAGGYGGGSGFGGGMQPQPTGYGQQMGMGYGGGGMQPQMTGYMPQQQTGFYPGGQQQGGGGYGGQGGYY
ncbi:hypothetical protein JCM8097_007650 [Rhodosporidiobolus ruineniae]